MLVNLLLIALSTVAAFWAWRRWLVSHEAPTILDSRPLADQIDDLLPQTQCDQCGFGGCRPYAEAMAAGEAPINRCPPGGERGIATLAALLERPIIELDPECGVEKPPLVAFIVEDACIGCTKCIQACPVDAIVGAAQQMHTVVTDLCTGCELCIPPCPVDCIDLLPAPSRIQETLVAALARPIERPQLPPNAPINPR